MANSKKETFGFNVNSFIKGSDENKNLYLVQDVPPAPPATTTKKTSKKKSNEAEVVDVVTTYAPQTSMSYVQDNIPYQIAYNDTNTQLDEAITQLDALGRETMIDMQMVRSSKTLKNKYGYLTDMTSNAVSIISAKIGAIKEKNKTINDINNLEIRRIKELKIQATQEDDNTRIANLYDAFINTPVGMGPNVLAPPIQDTMMIGGMDIPRASIGNDQMVWEQNLNPAENRMLLEAKGAIETVVWYDEATGNREFMVLDKMTGQPMDNVEKPDNSYIYELDINLRAGIAKDSNRNTVYRLVVVNTGNPSINNY